MLVSTGGVPLPPTDVVARLQLIDPRLGLRFQPGLGDESWWAITYQWVPDDPRWELVKTGKIAIEATTDIFAFLPRDCGADQACAYLENHFRKYDKADFRRMMANLRQLRAKEASDKGDEMIDTVISRMNVRKAAKEMGLEISPSVNVPEQIS